MSIADGDDEDLMGIETSQLKQAQSPINLQDHVLPFGSTLPSSPKASSIWRSSCSSANNSSQHAAPDAA